MKVSKIFGCVLSLHIGVIVVLLVQPGCQTGQPPTQIHTQDRTQVLPQDRTQARPQDRTQARPQAVTQTNTPSWTIRSNVPGAARSSGELIPATRLGAEGDLDAAFNAGFDTAATDDFGIVDALEPIEPLEPLEPISTGPTVELADAGYQSYTAKKGDSLWSIARRYSVSLDELYAANGLNKNSVIRVGQHIQIPGAAASVTVNPVTPDRYQPSGYEQATSTYTVQAGDSLSKIARRFDTSVTALKAANGKSSDMIRVGEMLTVPAAGTAVATAQTVAPAAAAPTPSTPSRTLAPSSGAARTHTVKAGEYPGKIARQYGMTTNELLAMNSITDPRKLRVGQELRVSGSGSAANVDFSTETVTRSATAQPVPVLPAQSTLRAEPTEIRVIEADPLVEGDFAEPEPDDIFENAIEIPVIRLEE